MKNIEKPFISIIIPTLNEEKYIERCLNSVKNQNFQDFEIIIVDNISRDNTVKIAKKYTDKVILTKKHGAGIARNIGTEIAKGEVLLFLDADTTLPNNLTEKIYETIKQDDKISYGAISLRFEGSCIKCKLVNFIFYFYEVFSIKQGIAGNCFFIKKELFDRTNGFRNIICEDTDLGLRLKGLGYRKDINDIHVISSSRRFKKIGYFRSLLVWFKQYWLIKLNKVKNITLNNYYRIR